MKVGCQRITIDYVGRANHKLIRLVELVEKIIFLIKSKYYFPCPFLSHLSDTLSPLSIILVQTDREIYIFNGKRKKEHIMEALFLIGVLGSSIWVLTDAKTIGVQK